MNKYICPEHRLPLTQQAGTYRCPTCGEFSATAIGGTTIINLLSDVALDSEKNNSLLYKGAQQNEIYANFLDWLFATFNTNETAFREKLLSKLKLEKNSQILITGCGNGGDLEALDSIFPSLLTDVWAQDISPEMIFFTAERLKEQKNTRFHLSISDACHLPYADNSFDAVFHFGGINFMPNVKGAIAEMARVAKNGGRVSFGDEGIAPWLEGSEYYDMMVENNALWASHTPIQLLPALATDVNVTWILENCFYFIDFIKNEQFPNVNLDVAHKGPRGGTIRTRHFGKLEGVSPEAKEIAIEQAKKAGLSIHKWLDQLIKS